MTMSISLVLAVVATFGFEDQSPLPEWTRRADAWVDGNPSGENGIYAVGSAADHQSLAWQLTRARADAKNEMASGLSTRIQATFTEYGRQAGDMFLDGTESFLENVESVSRQIAEASLIGLQQVEMHKDPTDGTLYVLYELPLDAAFVNRYQKEARAHMEKRFASYSRERKLDALSRLDQAIAESMTKIEAPSSPYDEAVEEPEARVHLPDWLRRPSACHAEELGGETVFYVVGSAAAHRDLSVQFERSRANAIVEMAAYMGTYAQSMLSEYQRQSGDMLREGMAPFIEGVVRQVTEASLNGLQRVDVYKDPRDGTLYVMYKLTLKHRFVERYKKEAAENLRQRFAEYSQRMKEEALAELDRVLDEMNEEIEESRHGDDTVEALPRWVRRPGAWSDGGRAGERDLYVVGTAADHNNPSLQLRRSRANAIGEMANVLSAQIQSMFAEYQRQVGGMFSAGASFLIDNVERVSRLVAVSSLVGLQKVEMYEDPSDGTHYVLYKLSLDTDFVNRYKKSARAQMRGRLPMSSPEQIEEALEMLDREIDESVKKMREPGSPDNTGS